MQNTITSRYSTKSSLLYHDGPLPASSGWYTDLNFNFLSAGKQYKLCVDHDRSSSDTGFEFSGETVVVTGVTAFSNLSVAANVSQDILLTCNTCTPGLSRGYVGVSPCLRNSTRAGVREWEGKRTASALMVNGLNEDGTFNETLFKMTLDASGLYSGQAVVVCVDEDGSKSSNGFEDVGGGMLVL